MLSWEYLLTFSPLFARMEPVTAAHALWHPALLDPHKKTSGRLTVRTSPVHMNTPQLVVKVTLKPNGNQSHHVHWHHDAADRILQGSAGLRRLCIIHKFRRILRPFCVFLFRIWTNLIMPSALFYNVKIHSTEFPSKKKTWKKSADILFAVREMSLALLYKIWLNLLEEQLRLVQNE